MEYIVEKVRSVTDLLFRGRSINSNIEMDQEKVRRKISDIVASRIVACNYKKRLGIADQQFDTFGHKFL